MYCSNRVIKIQEKYSKRQTLIRIYFFPNSLFLIPFIGPPSPPRGFNEKILENQLLEIIYCMALLAGQT